MAVLVSVIHSVAMIAAGGCLAFLVYRYLGLKFLSRSWFNLDATWAFSLVLVGALSLAIGLAYSGSPILVREGDDASVLGIHTAVEQRFGTGVGYRPKSGRGVSASAFAAAAVSAVAKNP